MTEITNINQLPKTGKVVLAVVKGNRAPCRKFLGELNQAIGILNKSDISFFFIQLTDEVKESFRITIIPTAVVLIDGVEMKRFEGHWIYHFEMVNKINEGLLK